MPLPRGGLHSGPQAGEGLTWKTWCALAAAETLVILTLLLRVHSTTGSDAISYAWVAATLTVEPLPTATSNPTQEPLLTPAEFDALPKAVPVAETPPPVQAQEVEAPVPVSSVPEPTPAPPPLPTPVQPPPSTAGRLSEGQAREVLIAAGWSPELLPAALSVACGIGNARWPNGESGCHPGASNGRYKGLFQLDTPFWFDHCGEAPNWDDPVSNARVALCVYNYSLARGNDGWHLWDVKP